MSYFTRRQLEIACLQYEDDDGYEFFDAIKEKKSIDLGELGIVRYVEDHRPSGDYDEDHDGEYIDVIFRIGERHFRKSGVYSSWDSDDWDGPFEEVTEARIQRTEWVNINKRGE